MTGRARTARILAIAAASVAAGACVAGPQGFEAFFEEVGRIELEEFPDDPIVGVHQVSRRPGGGLILADQAAARVRLFDATGRQEEVLGRRGDGPAEFQAPTAAVELIDGSLLVTDGADPDLTIFTPGRDVQRVRIPGQYGFWIERLGGTVVVGLGSRGNRFAILESNGDSIRTFGPVPSEVNEVPYWIFFARDRATVAKDRVVINTAFYPTLRIFSSNGDSIGAIGTPPRTWVPPTPPPTDGITDDSDRERLEAWLRTFTVVRGMATVADSLVVVQYGSHDPQASDPYYVQPATIDVYTLDGDRIAEGLALPQPILGGGRELLVLSAQPPDPWTITAYRWRR